MPVRNMHEGDTPLGNVINENKLITQMLYDMDGWKILTDELYPDGEKMLNIIDKALQVLWAQNAEFIKNATSNKRTATIYKSFDETVEEWYRRINPVEDEMK